MKNILIEVGSIKPGGGPSGYTYNLLEGYKKVKLNYPNLNIYSLASLSTDRTKSILNLSDKNIFANIKYFISKHTPYFIRQIKFRFSTKRKSMLNADIVFFQGIQSSTAIKSIKNMVYTIYMPHTPTIAANEVLMNSKLYNFHLSNKEYRRIIKQELELIDNADCVVFASKGAAEEYWKKFTKELKNKKIEYIASGIDLPDLNHKLQINTEILGGVLFVGRYVQHKGYDLYCLAATLVSSLKPDIKFYSIGGGPIKSNNHVIDLGWQENPYPFIQSASIIVIPNIYSYYDLLPLECAALGKPLILTKVGGNIDQLNELPDSVGCNTEINNLAETIIKSYEKSKIEPNWGIKNQIKYKEFFNSESFAHRWCDFFNGLNIEK